MNDDYRCGAFDGKFKDEEDWLKKHKGHEITEEVDEYELCDGAAVKKMHHRKCHTCNHRYLYKMETVERDSNGG